MPCYFCSFSEILSKHNPCMVLWERQMHIFISQDLESCHYSKGNPKTVQLVTCLENTTNEQFRFVFENSMKLSLTITSCTWLIREANHHCSFIAIPDQYKTLQIYFFGKKIFSYISPILHVYTLKVISIWKSRKMCFYLSRVLGEMGHSNSLTWKTPFIFYRCSLFKTKL